MTAPLVLAIDQGTSATKCLLVDQSGAVVGRASAPLDEHHPQPGWVEQDGTEVWRSVCAAVRACMQGHAASSVVAVGLATQRESLLLWDAHGGAALSPVISWQDQRGGGLCEALRTQAAAELVRARSGLPLDPMFSATKARWLLDRYDPDRTLSRQGRVRLGTIDSWLLHCLSGEHLIEAGNASRTQLLNLRTLDWDGDLLDLFAVPRACLPRVVASTGPFPAVRGLPGLRDGTPLLAVLGDSHAALFGHGVRAPGPLKATYGTGCSVMGLCDGPDLVAGGLCLTVAWVRETPTYAPTYAVEGNIRSAGSALRWMAAILGIDTPALVALGLAADSHGVVLVPGFGGLGAPWWERDAIGLLANLTLGSSRAGLARAALESLVLQVDDLVEAVATHVGPVRTIFADGGACRSDGLMQMQADQLGRVVLRAPDAELSALGAADLAGLAGDIWTEDQLAARPRPRDRFVGRRQQEQPRLAARRHWHAALARAGVSHGREAS